MFYLIYPEDDTTSFLSPVATKLNDILKDDLTLIQIKPDLPSYNEAKVMVASIPDGSFVFFMGHGTKQCLYGGACKGFEKRQLFGLQDMGIFSNKSLMLLSCNSNGLLLSARTRLVNSNLLGFGQLPTSLGETESPRDIRSLGLTQEDVDFFNTFLTNEISESIKFAVNSELTVENIYRRLKLALNAKMNALVLEDKDRKRADLLFIVRRDMVCY